MTHKYCLCLRGEDFEQLGAWRILFSLRIIFYYLTILFYQHPFNVQPEYIH
jgi:hypothetical protein